MGGTQLALKKGHTPHHFWAHVYYGQTAGWIKMPLGTKVGLGPCHIVLDGDPTGSPSNTKSPWPRPTSISSGTLIHRAVWLHKQGLKLENPVLMIT